MQTGGWRIGHDDISDGPIRVQVTSIGRLFSAMDPTPIDQRELDAEVEDWIVGWAEDLPSDREVVLDVLIGDGDWVGSERDVEAGIHQHFAYREWSTGKRLARLMRDGRISLVIGLTALVLLTGASRLIDSTGGSTLAGIVEDGLIVAGWVAMWRPMEIFLYEWWPIRRERRIFRRLSEAAVVLSTGVDRTD